MKFMDLIIAAWTVGRCDRTGVDEMLMALTILVLAVALSALVLWAVARVKTNSMGVL